MIGDAIGLAAQSFERAEVQGRLLVLLTDGNDTGSRVPPTRRVAWWCVVIKNRAAWQMTCAGPSGAWIPRFPCPQCG